MMMYPSVCLTRLTSQACHASPHEKLGFAPETTRKKRTQIKGPQKQAKGTKSRQKDKHDQQTEQLIFFKFIQFKSSNSLGSRSNLKNLDLLKFQAPHQKNSFLEGPFSKAKGTNKMPNKQTQDDPCSSLDR